MTIATKYAPLRPATPVVAVAALLLAGCSSGNIGESWQCPLAEGGTCNSVAAADPAVPDAGTAGGTVLKDPLWRVRPAEPAGKPQMPPCEAGCGGFDPFGWLLRLFGVGDPGSLAGAGAVDGEGPGSDPGSMSRVGAEIGGLAAGEPGPVTADMTPEADASPTAPDGTEFRAGDAAAAALPAEPDPAHDDPVADDLRTGEIVARIWIAPFVDADGVYREASHVRVVLEPSGWRLPR